jgi:undecaprenyl-diphosphatase
MIAFRQTFDVWEVRAILYIYNATASSVPTFYLLTQLGSLWMVLVVALFVVMKNRHKLALELLISGFTAYGVAVVMKGVVNRPRPSGLVHGVMPRIEEAVGLGFPSGHSAVAAALATTCWFMVPKRHRFILVIWVVLVAFSRIALGLHAPLDIIGGIAIGVGTGTTIHYIFSKRLPRIKGKLLTAYARAKIRSKKVKKPIAR